MGCRYCDFGLFRIKPLAKAGMIECAIVLRSNEFIRCWAGRTNKFVTTRQEAILLIAQRSGRIKQGGTARGQPGRNCGNEEEEHRDSRERDRISRRDAN